MYHILEMCAPKILMNEYEMSCMLQFYFIQEASGSTLLWLVDEACLHHVICLSLKNSKRLVSLFYPLCIINI
jgi:hypothetical protein